MTLRRVIVPFALGLAYTTAAAAQTTPVIVLDSTELELSERSAAKQTVDFLIPAKLNFDGVKIRRWSIKHG